MKLKRILVVLVVLSFQCASSFLGVQARPFILSWPRPSEVKKDADWLHDEAQHTGDFDDFGVGEGRVDEIIAATEKWRKSSEFTAPRTVRGVAYSQLDEIDRLKLSINKIICESMEEGCDHMEDMEDASAEESTETFANLKPEEYVRVDD